MKNVILVFIIMLAQLGLSAQHTVTVNISELENNKGKVIVSLLDKNEKDVMDASSTISNNTCSVTLKNVKPGEYAIRFFHDANQDKELNMNILGIPKEGCGFSNNALGKFGPKDYEAWLFKVDGDKTLKLKTFYLF